MRIGVAALAAFLVTFAVPASSRSEPYGWTISASNTDPYVNAVEPNFSIDTFYLWLACCDVPAYPDGTARAQGFTAAEFALVFTGIQILAATPALGCVAGDPPPPPPDFLIFCTGCPCGPIPVASLLVFNFPGSICFAPSVANGRLGAVDCEAQPELWGIDWIGIDTTGKGPPCSGGLPCQDPVAVDAASWGRVKGLYRRSRSDRPRPDRGMLGSRPLRPPPRRREVLREAGGG
jgi:hypothetical protein